MSFVGAGEQSQAACEPDDTHGNDLAYYASP